MAPPRQQLLAVAPTKMTAHNTLVLAGDGTAGSRTALRTVLELAARDVQDELLGVILTDWNQEVANLARWVPPSTFYRSPRDGIPGLPHGFRNEARLAERTRQHWEPNVERWWNELHRRSSTLGLSCGVVIDFLGGGGHTAVSRTSVPAGKEHFPDALHLGFYFLPSDDRSLWGNLRRYDGYPDELGIPIVLVDNAHRQRVDQAVPRLLATLIAGQRHTDKGQRTYGDSFANTARETRLLSLAHASVELPVVPLPLWERAVRWFRGASDSVPGVAEQEVALKLAELLVAVLQPEAKLLACPEPDPGAVQFIAIGGLPIDWHGQPWLPEAREQFQKHVTRLASRELAARDQLWPPGLSVVWSSGVDVTPQEFVRVHAVRVFAIPDRTARDYIDPMLAEKPTTLGVPWR